MAVASAYAGAQLSPEAWPAFVALAQRHNGIFGGCRCIWFRTGHDLIRASHHP